MPNYLVRTSREYWTTVEADSEEEALEYAEAQVVHGFEKWEHSDAPFEAELEATEFPREH